MTAQTLETLRTVANEGDPSLMYLALIDHIAAGLPEFKLTPFEALCDKIGANKVVLALAQVTVAALAVFEIVTFVQPFVTHIVR